MPRKYQIDTAENIAFLEKIREDLLYFGQNFPSPDGTAYFLKDNGQPDISKPRKTFETARMCHVYAIAQKLYGEHWGKLTEQSKAGLMKTLYDREFDGWFDEHHSNGQTESIKSSYTHAFVILAAGDLLMIDDPDSRSFLDKSLQCFNDFFWIESDQKACDAWDRDFTERSTYRGLNANMHTVEALLNVADATGEASYRDKAGLIIRFVVDQAKATNWRIPEHYTENWVVDFDYNKLKPNDPFKPYGVTPGHGFEWSRLILQWASSKYHRESSDFAYYLEVCQSLFKRALEDSWFVDGAPGFLYTTDWEGKPLVRERRHWVLAEAINTSAVLYRVTKSKEYSTYYSWFMQYLDEKVLDHENGSWFHRLNSMNQPLFSGKPDLYHAFQATLLPYCDVRYSLCKAVVEKKFVGLYNEARK